MNAALAADLRAHADAVEKAARAMSYTDIDMSGTLHACAKGMREYADAYDRD